MSIDDELKKMNFKFDLSTTLLKIKANSISNNYYLKRILELQIELIELNKGKVGQELETSVESRIQSINNKIYDLVQKEMIHDADFSDD